MAVACGVYGDVFFPRGVLDEILNLIESVSKGFPSYSWNNCNFLIKYFAFNEL